MAEILIREFARTDYQQVYNVWEASGLGMRTSDTLPELEKVLERFRAKGVNKVNLMVTAANLAVCEYYKKMGFILHDYVVMGIPLRGKY